MAANVNRLAVSTGISCSVSLAFVLYQSSNLLLKFYSSACIAANHCCLHVLLYMRHCVLSAETNFTYLWLFPVQKEF